MSLSFETWYWLWLGYAVISPWFVKSERRDLFFAIGLINANVMMAAMKLAELIGK